MSHDDTYWVQSLKTHVHVTRPITLSVLEPVHDTWTLAAVEIPAATSSEDGQDAHRFGT